MESNDKTTTPILDYLDGLSDATKIISIANTFNDECEANRANGNVRSINEKEVAIDYVILQFDATHSIKLLINEYTISCKFDNSEVFLGSKQFITSKSVNKIFPLDTEVLVAEYGMVGLMALINNTQTNKGISVAAALMVVGVGHNVPEYISVGLKFIPKNREEFALRDVIDPENDYSFQRLSRRAEKDKELLAAVTIAHDKSQSKIGLRMTSDTVSTSVIEKANQLRDNKSFGNNLFRDEKIEFVNYKLMNYTNIAAIIL